MVLYVHFIKQIIFKVVVINIVWYTFYACLLILSIYCNVYYQIFGGTTFLTV
jgi:hypothetical protein